MHAYYVIYSRSERDAGIKQYSIFSNHSLFQMVNLILYCTINKYRSEIGRKLQFSRHTLRRENITCRKAAVLFFVFFEQRNYFLYHVAESMLLLTRVFLYYTLCIFLYSALPCFIVDNKYFITAERIHRAYTEHHRWMCTCYTHTQRETRFRKRERCMYRGYYIMRRTRSILYCMCGLLL